MRTLFILLVLSCLAISGNACPSGYCGYHNVPFSGMNAQYYHEGVQYVPEPLSIYYPYGHWGDPTNGTVIYDMFGDAYPNPYGYNLNPFAKNRGKIGFMNRYPNPRPYKTNRSYPSKVKYKFQMKHPYAVPSPAR